MNHGLPEPTVERIRQVLGGFPEIERAVLYGSRAKGTHKTGSDIDLTLHGADLTRPLRAAIAEALDELSLPYTIDLSLFADLKHPEFEAHIERVGVVFYERGSGGNGEEAR